MYHPDPIERSDLLSRQNDALYASWARELMRQGVHERTYTAIELDHARQWARNQGLTLESDGHGNLLTHADS